MSAKRHERTFARRSTVQVLYTSEIQNERPSVLLDTGRCLNEDGPLPEYALTLIDGVEAHRDVIDAYLESTSENWALSRMPIVDRTILRLAVFEMVYVKDVPVSVAINEAVELAKDFGGEDESPRFVNGVLGRIAKQLEAEAAEAAAAAAAGAAGAEDGAGAEERDPFAGYDALPTAGEGEAASEGAEA
ncbi:transcription antitermination factor NusB [Adlercreutzia sp. ZJ473]|uniref:transcription antitermination factor NusB n=1 Tax=Adlercreutzia sp. ZJ473 TaxID=2722822 RepID=UPI001554CE50|nr:transcription antitermination factor NusB [Adlercreutzia sp. ZJ473]